MPKREPARGGPALRSQAVITPLPPARLVAAIESETAGIAACVASDPSRPVPTCPGWTLSALAGHLGTVQRWATQMVASGSLTRLERSTLTPPTAPADRARWLVEGAGALIDTLAAAPLARPVWIFDRPDGRVALWVRRMAHEAQIHRVDAEEAVGALPAFDPALAADGVDEFLQVMLPRRFQSGPVPGWVATLGLRCDDTESAWTVRLAEREAAVEPQLAADAACRLSGPAGELLRFVWNRPPGPDLRIDGERAQVDSWRREVRP